MLRKHPPLKTGWIRSIHRGNIMKGRPSKNVKETKEKKKYHVNNSSCIYYLFSDFLEKKNLQNITDFAYTLF